MTVGRRLLSLLEESREDANRKFYVAEVISSLLQNCNTFKIVFPGTLKRRCKVTRSFFSFISRSRGGTTQVVLLPELVMDEEEGNKVTNIDSIKWRRPEDVRGVAHPSLPLQRHKSSHDWRRSRY